MYVYGLECKTLPALFVFLYGLVSKQVRGVRRGVSKPARGVSKLPGSRGWRRGCRNVRWR